MNLQQRAADITTRYQQTQQQLTEYSAELHRLEGEYRLLELLLAEQNTASLQADVPSTGPDPTLPAVVPFRRQRDDDTMGPVS